MRAFVASFQLWLKAAGYRPDTVERAVRVVRQYVHFVSAEGYDHTTAESVQAFLAAASSRVRPQTHLNYWKDLALAFDYAVSEGLVVQNFVRQIPRPRPSIHERERDVYYTDEDVGRLIDVCPHWNWLGLRDRAILITLWTTGIRAGEICRLSVEDLDWEEGEISVKKGKGGVAYSQPLRAECFRALRRYILARPADSEWLFVDYHGHDALSRHGLEQLLRRLAKRAGWKKACFPHGFRHTWNANAREQLGMDERDAAALLGHSSVGSNRSYGRRRLAESAKDRYREALARQGDPHRPYGLLGGERRRRG